MRQLGSLLVEKGLISPGDLEQAEAARAMHGGRLAATLVRLGAVGEDVVVTHLSALLRAPLLAATEQPPQEAIRAAMLEFGLAPGWLAARQTALWRGEDGGLRLASAQLDDLEIQEAAEQWGVPRDQRFLASSEQLDALLRSLAGSEAIASQPSRRLRELAEQAPIIDLVNTILQEAVQQRASDVHFEPFEDAFLVRLRIDGVLREARRLGRDLFDAVASRIKLLSGIDIAERRLPQDGRQSLRVAGRDLDVRVSSLPTQWGESIVLRLLTSAGSLPELDALGATPAQGAALRTMIEAPSGLVLVTGPTGSGKTTTVYRLLTHLNDGVRKIVTTEDPIEMNLPGVLQTQVKPDIGLSFANGLRSILRQDPDVILVGEIRDPETARIAVQASLTGHLVISTLHTNSALAAVARLLDLGVESFLLAEVLRGLVGQRLLRRPCPHCAVPHQDGVEETFAARHLPHEDLALAPAAWVRGHGCPACGRTGHLGRIGVFEIAHGEGELRKAVRARADEEDLTRLAQAQGFRTLLQDGLAKGRAGRTSWSEIMRVLGV